MVSIGLGNGYELNIDLVVTMLIIFAVIVIMLVLSFVSLIVLLRQNSILKSINKNLLAVPHPVTSASAAPSAPAQQACSSCGAAVSPGMSFCQKCGSPL